ncbi:alcohol dehydrogenase [Desulfocucumis palustris]|uniref:Alcohol dehydrogenase n=1 Tax=Desulfocucumis palustris TaxID=1898651 RepID=A0A2L2XAJ9_9FIRM|nr:alcohol dehydrogenase [Desulfocucumis palustris]
MAAVVIEPGKLEIQDLPVPGLGKNDVLVKVASCGVCGSDVHAFEGNHFRTTYPRVLGHEFSGVVAEIGSGVTNFKCGDRVCAETNIPCGVCKICNSGLPHLCKSVIVIGFNADGGYAQYVKVPADNLIPVPHNMTLDQATLTQPLGVGYKAVVDHSCVEEGTTVAVLGAGPIGLGAIATASARGGNVIAIDLFEHKLKTAKKMGAMEVINGKEEDVVSKVLELTDGHGVDAVFECAGGDQDVTIQQATQIVRRRGEVIVVGTFGKKGARVRMNDLRAGEITIKGTRGQYKKYAPCLEMVSNGQIDVMPMLTHTVSLENTLRGIELMAGKTNQQVIKVLLKPND